MIDNGTVLELKVSKKIEEYQFLVLNTHVDFPGRLHIRNLSNNHELSAKMFELIEEGDVLTVGIVGFNKEKKYYDLSTRIFRNDLDDILSFTKCRNIIRNAYNRRNDNGALALREYRGILDRLRGDLSSSDLTFLYELLQNAVDHPNPNFNNQLLVHFEVFGEYLLLKHNGSLFTEDNFNAIAGILLGEQNEDKAKNRIGYKGIGFKSVFRHFNDVYVRSGNFSFSFNESITGADKPWEVMPIFQNEIEKIDEIPQFDFFNVPVAFAFKFTSEEERQNVINHLNKLEENPYLLGFLRNLKELRITTPAGQEVFKKDIEREDNKETVELNIEEETERWDKHSDIYEITDSEVIKELTDKSDKSIPENFRNFRNPKIEILIPHKKVNGIVNLFSYLPLSNTRYQFSYIVNSDFIPNLDRTNFITNLKYNSKIVAFIAVELLKTCEKLAADNDYSRLKWLIPSSDTNEIKYKEELQSHFLKNSGEYSFIPNFYNDDKLSLNQVTLDKTKLYEVLSEEEYQQLVNQDRLPLDIDSGLKTEFSFLIKETGIGAIFEAEDLMAKLEDTEFQNWLKQPENNFKFICFLQDNKKAEILETNPIILSEDNELELAKDIYNSIPNTLQFLNLKQLNKEVKSALDEEDRELYIINKFTINNFLEEEIFEKKDDINETIGKSEEANLNFWKFIYDHWDTIKTNDESVNKLSVFKVLGKNSKEEKSFYPIRETYLSKEYAKNPEFEALVNKILPDKSIFISDYYIDQERTINQWFKIFKKIGAIADLQELIQDIIPILSELGDEQHFIFTQQLFKYWKKNRDEENSFFSEEQEELIREHLKLKCTDGKFRIAKDSIISDYYNNNDLISEWVSTIILPNRISSEYAKGYQQWDWKTFFDWLKCKSLQEKQEIVDKKIAYYLKYQEQEDLRRRHFEILKNLSVLYINKSKNKLRFNFKDQLSFIKLIGNNNNWYLPDELYSSSKFNPKMDLQADEKTVQFENKIVYLNKRYCPENTNKYFLNALGIDFDFKIKNIERVPRLEVKEIDYWNAVFKDKRFQKDVKRLVQNWYYSYHINSKLYLFNHFVLKYHFLLKDESYYDKFIDYLESGKTFDFLIQNTDLSIWANRRFPQKTFIYFILNYYPNLETESGKRDKPQNLFSKRLEKYIEDDSLIPKKDLTKITVNSENKTLEETIGVKQGLSERLCLNLLHRTESRLTLDELKTLRVVESLSDYQPTEEEKDKTFVLNKKEQWKSINQLCVEGDDNLDVNPRHIVHEYFEPLVKSFRIQEISESKLLIKIEPKTLNEEKEIRSVFETKAKFISFYISEKEDKELTENIIEKVSSFVFYECDSIKSIFPETNPIYEKNLEIYRENNKIFYAGYWQRSKQVIDFIYEQIINDNSMKKKVFTDLITKWSETEIIEKLDEDVSETPEEWNTKSSDEDRINISRREQGTKDKFKADIESDLNDLSDYYGNDVLNDLKEILMGFNDTSNQEYRNSLNDLLKLKFLKSKEIQFQSSYIKANQISLENQKYIFHSARGNFAYIILSEIEQVEEGAIMVIDFGRGLDNFNEYSFEELLGLNFHHIYFQESSGKIEEVYDFVSRNREYKKLKMLLVDPQKELAQTLNLVEENRSENVKAERDPEASDLI